MVDVATFTELPDSPLPYAGTCSAWQIVQFDGFGYVSCGDYPLQSKASGSGRVGDNARGLANADSIIVNQLTNTGIAQSPFWT